MANLLCLYTRFQATEFNSMSKKSDTQSEQVQRLEFDFGMIFGAANIIEDSCINIERPPH